jgi:hypothetical protein
LEMRISSSALLALGVFSVAVPSAFALAQPPVRQLAPPVRRPAFVPASRSAQRIRRIVSSGCSANYGTFGNGYFIGTTGGANFADGADSAVLAGSSNESCGDNSAIGAGTSDLITDTGNASTSFIGAGNENTMESFNAFIGSGESGDVDAYDAFIGAGSFNTVTGAGGFAGAGGTQLESMAEKNLAGVANVAGGRDSFVGSGDVNQITPTGNGSFIGAGGFLDASQVNAPTNNRISGVDSFIGAGDTNSVSSNDAFIGSGLSNVVDSAATYATLVGGAKNVVSGQYGAIVGGYGNTASGSYALIVGGNGNTASGTLSFASGYHADAVHNGSFVWSDYVSGSVLAKDTAANQFIVRASGGTYVFSNEAGTAGVKLAAGSGTWASLSDRNAKTDVVALDDASILAKVVALPVSAWRYKSESGVRHMGPMAQDFYSAFGVGEDDRHIASIDEDGVALAAIKALHRENLSLRADNRGLHEENAGLLSRLASLERRMNAFGRATARP